MFSYSLTIPRWIAYHLAAFLAGVLVCGLILALVHALGISLAAVKLGLLMPIAGILGGGVLMALAHREPRVYMAEYRRGWAVYVAFVVLACLSIAYQLL